MAARVPLALAFVALTVLAAAAVLALVAPHASAQIIPEVKVELDAGQESQVAGVTDLVGDPDITFTGTITVTRLFSPNSVTVNPNAFVENADARWKVTPNPSKLTYNGSGSQPFTIVVSAPANLSAGATFTVTFNATASGLLYYNTVSDMGYIEVLQYFKLGQFSSSEVIHIKQGESRTLNFTVQNRGNGDDTVNIALGNEAELGLRGISVLYDRTKRLEPWQSAKIAFILTTDIDATPGDAKFNFTLKSTGSGERVTSSVDFSLVVEKALIKGLFIKYWWAIGVGIALLIMGGVLVMRRRGRRRADEEALAQLQYTVPVKKAAPPRKVAGGPRRPARPRERDDEAEEGDIDGDAPQEDEGTPLTDGEGPDAAGEDDDAVEVQVGAR
jgi:hypothetical protein